MHWHLVDMPATNGKHSLWFIFKRIWLVLGAGAVRNRTYRRGRTDSCASLVSIKVLAN